MVMERLPITRKINRKFAQEQLRGSGMEIRNILRVQQGEASVVERLAMTLRTTLMLHVVLMCAKGLAEASEAGTVHTFRRGTCSSLWHIPLNCIHVHHLTPY